MKAKGNKGRERKGNKGEKWNTGSSQWGNKGEKWKGKENDLSFYSEGDRREIAVRRDELMRRKDKAEAREIARRLA